MASRPGLLGAAEGDAEKKICEVVRPTASLTVHHVDGSPELSADPNASVWKDVGEAAIEKDCTHVAEYKDLNTRVLGFWTDTDLYLLFICPFKELNLFLPAMGGGPRVKLWDRDVVEMFLGSDWQHIRRYREFEIAPTGDWIDLAIDLDKDSYDPDWRSGWETKAQIEQKSKTWYAAARIPLKAVSTEPVQTGTKWRANLYRIEGLGDDSKRHFMCWQPTCVVKRDANHVPENFGTVVFAK